MRIRIVTPAPPGSRKGNRVTALRWARFLRELGHAVAIQRSYRGGEADLLIALHARRSFAAARRFRERYPGRPLLVALTGTDLYRDLRSSPEARRALELADRILVLQPLAVEEVPEALRPRARVIFQSVPAPRARPAPVEEAFEVCVLGHLRAVKDPFRAALAARRLPAESRVRVLHLGAALNEAAERRARAEMARNPRYHWLGELPRPRALAVLARSRALVLSSRLEGGANVLSEALAAGVPALASRIPGSVGILGEEYPGYFEVGNTRQLAALLRRAETDRAFYQGLRRWCAGRQGLVDPARERETWRRLLEELAPNGKERCG